MGPCYSFFEIAPADRIVVVSGKYLVWQKGFIPEMPKRAVRECSDTFTHATIIKKLSAPETILSRKKYCVNNRDQHMFQTLYFNLYFLIQKSAMLRRMPRQINALAKFQKMTISGNQNVKKNAIAPNRIPKSAG